MSRKPVKQQCSFPDNKSQKKANPQQAIVKYQKQPKPAKHGMSQFAASMLKDLVSVHKKCKARADLAATAAQPVQGGWLSVSSKPDVKMSGDDPYSEFKTALSMTRGALASMYGSKPVPFLCHVATQIGTSVVTTGITATVTSVDVSTLNEWNSLAALFDEYRIVEGRADYYVVAPTSTIVLGTSSIGTTACCTVAFDPADATASTTGNDLMQLEYHHRSYPRIVPTATAGTYVGVYGKADTSPYVLRWKYHDSAMVTGNGGVVAPGMWKATAGNVTSFPDGSIKTFYVNGEVTASKTVIAADLWYTLQFRCRT